MLIVFLKNSCNSCIMNVMKSVLRTFCLMPNISHTSKVSRNSYQGLADSRLFPFVSVYLSHSFRPVYKVITVQSAICGLTFHSFPQVTCDVCENSLKGQNGGISRSNWLYFRKYHIVVLFWLEKWRPYFKGSIIFSYLFSNDFMILFQGLLCFLQSPIQKLNQQCSFLLIRFQLYLGAPQVPMAKNSTTNKNALSLSALF